MMGFCEAKGGEYVVSNRYTWLMELMSRPQGCRIEEACAELGVTRAGCRGMIRDLRAVVRVETVYGRHGGRGRGRSAVHFIRPGSLAREFPSSGEAPRT